MKVEQKLYKCKNYSVQKSIAVKDHYKLDKILIGIAKTVSRWLIEM